MHTKRLLAALGITICLNGCTIPEVKTPEFEKEANVIIDEIKKVKDFQDVNIQWKTNSFGDKTTDILVLQLINGKNMSDAREELNQIGKSAMQLLNNSIKNESDYEVFQVVFIQKSNGAITKSFSNSFAYKLEDLK